MHIPRTPPEAMDIWRVTKDADIKLKIIRGLGIVDYKNRYWHWDKMRYLTPPKGFTVEQWWAGTKFSRRSAYIQVPLFDSEGKSFQFCLPPIIHQALHEIDMRTGGTISSTDFLLNPNTKSTYLIKSLVDEAISSSQLEGAATTRNVAKEMIRQGRPPKDKSEQMIFNNYEAMRFITELKGEKLNLQTVMELHRMLVDETLPDTQSGTFRRKEDLVQVIDTENNVLHDPPAAEELEDRMETLCSFANGESTTEFIHPVVRAIILHFMLAYDHPFVDGNGRTARALFYWAMAAEDYWLMEFISLSKIIKRAPIKYGTAYLHTENDDNDLTYFIFHQIDAIKKALAELEDYLEKKRDEVEEAQALISQNRRLNTKLNFRQLSLIRHALEHPRFTYMINEHKNSHGVSYDTARKDLIALSDRLGLLEKQRDGKTLVFVVPADLAARLAA
jgi:Fic family protein